MAKINCLLVPLALLAAGCASTKVACVETGLFGNDPEKILEISETIERNADQPLTRAELEEMGFDFEAPNVQTASGAAALRTLFQEIVFQGADGGSAKEFSDYNAFIVPYLKVVTTTDRIYFSEKETFQRGEKLLVIVVFKQDTLCFFGVSYVNLDTYTSYYAFGEGLLTIIESPGKAAIGILEALNEFQPEFAPVPGIGVPIIIH